ncbi:serine hydrolase [Hymenobacter terrenus]|uniref:serine hydrolase n=1 Tax=Hymenobacter terrenus TaxID=1629124 RepID=UPI0006199289|nr:serine hydrolase [Hymenobacter terrenus]
MFHRSAFVLIGLFGLGSQVSQAQEVNTAKLDSLLTALTVNNKLMGSVALSRNGTVVYSRAFGYQQLDGTTKIPATTATCYRVGSISKMFTATIIFQLIEEGKLTLATTLATYFPELPNAQSITVGHLLGHRSGLHSFTSDAAYKTYFTQPKTQAELLAIIGQTKADFAPGTKAEYSNTNYVVLSYIIEKITKRPYAQVLQQRVVAKAALKSTYYGGKINPQKQESYSYAAGGSGWVLAPETDMSIPSGAGGVVSTPTDLNRFLEALFGGKLVAPASLQQMQTITDRFGLGLFKLPFGTKASYGHAGSIDGFAAITSYFPDEKLAVALCSNAQAYSTNEVLLGVLNIYFQRPYRIPSFQASTFTPTPADLDRYAGTYATPRLPLKITMQKEGNTLRAQATGQSAFLLEPVSKDVFKFDQSGIRIQFDPAKPEFTLQQGGGSFLFTKE